MAESLKGELDIEEIDIKSEIVSIQEEILPSSTVEDTYTLFLQEEDMGMDATEIKGKQLIKPFAYLFIMNILLNIHLQRIYVYLLRSICWCTGI